ncbi:hypothetical protein LAZ67_21001978, partial [Cordylochernes scorpioides]
MSLFSSFWKPFSDSFEEHLEHLHLFFQLCRAENIRLNLNKCQLCKTSISFLGYEITQGTYKPHLTNTQVIGTIQPPTNVKTLQSFLGVVNVYHKFIPHYAQLRSPLNILLKKNIPFKWTLECQKAFEDLKSSLTASPVLHIFKEDLPCFLYCDASTLGISGILKQKDENGEEHPVQYFSRSLRKYEQNYSISELECLAIIESIEYFRVYLLGRHFTIYSDHQALVYLKNIKNPSVKPPKGPLAKVPYELMSMDTVAVFNKYGGNRAYLHVICDHMSRYCWTFPSKSTSTLTYIQILKRVFQEGIPKNLLTDRAPAFTSAQFRRFLISQGIKPLYTTANHPQSNGLSERLNATITGKLNILHLEHPKQKWTKQIERVTRIYNLTPHTVTGFPPIYLLKGIVPNNLNNHFQTFPELSEARRIALQKTQARHKAEKLMYDQKHKKIDFVPGDLVLVKVYRHPNTPKLEPNYTGLYEILEILSPQVVRINRPNRPLQLQTEIINIEKLRRYVENIPHITPPTDLPDSPPRQNYFLFPYRHFTTDILGDPGSSRPRKWFQPFNHLDNSIFTDEKFYKPNFPITSKPTFSSIVKPTKSSTLVLDPKINPFDNMVEKSDMEDKSSWEIWSDKNDEAFGIIITTLTNEQAGMFIGETNAKKDCRNLRLFVTDKNTGLRFLVDSGADISIIPPKDKNRMPSSDYKLYAANGTEIVTYGTKVRNLDIGLRRQFQWPFVIANTNRAIIEADFLNNFGLIIDIKNKRLIDGITNLSIRGVIQSISDMGNISTLNSSSKVSAILTKYPNLCRPPSDFVEAKHSVKHYIPTRGQPIHSKARRLDSQRLTLAKAEFQYMLNNGIIRPSNSPWASPLHLFSKKDESLRPCGDYRRLNAVTLPDRYPIPRLDDFHHILKGTRVYSKIDLCKAFYQIPIAEEDKPKTAIITPFGLFEFNVMSFGLRNATATFQRFMHEVLRNLDFAFVYLDDILVASKTEEEHYSHLETLFSRLNSYGLRINLSKSKFLVQEIDFLGYLITSHGVKPLPTKVKAILEYKKPKTVHELRIFLGMLNFYRTFLNNAAETQEILHEYLRGAKKKDRSEIKWTEEAEVQFEKCKQALANTALLAYPDTELPISLCTDASDRAVGSVLQQLDNKNWKPIAFFSKKLNPAQCNYSTYDRELLAIYLSIKFFKHLLEAREFTILTDHKPLIYAFKQKNEKASPRQLRHLQYISQFTTDIKYIKGTDNIVADALSRVDAITTIDYEEIAKEQTGDSELQNLISKNTSLKFKQCPLQSGNLLWCDVSTNNIRPFIPIKFRMMVFRNFHELSHPGIKATTKQLTSRFIWPNMNKDIRKWAQACVNCQKCKVSIHTKSEIGKYQEVDERFSVVHIDLIGALPPSNGNIYCLTCIDRYTSWMEVVPLPDMKSETVARAFYENWIVRFGAPHTVISDQGKQFTSQLFKDLTTLCGIKLRHSTAYHPQCNGKIERLHRTIKTAIRAHNSIKTDRVKKPLEPPYEGPFPVLERTDKYFTLKVKGKNVTTSIDRLRPAYLLADSDNITAEHPTAPRPIVSGALPSTSCQQNPDPPDVEKYTEFQGTGSAPDLPRTRSGRIIKKPSMKKTRSNTTMIEQTHNQVPQEPTTDSTVAASLRTLTLCLDQLLNREPEEAITYDGDEPAAHFFSQLESQPNFHNLEPARQARKALSSLRGEPRKIAQDLALLNKTYEEVKESLCAVYPRRPSFTLQEFYELKCTSMAEIETYYKNKVRIGLAINLPKCAIMQALSNGVPRNYGNLLKMAQPSGPEEWLCLAQQLTYEGDNTSTKAAQQRSPRQSRAPSTTVDKTPPYPCRYCGGQHWHAQCQQRGPYQQTFRTFTPAVHNVEQPQRSTGPAGVYETAATTSSGKPSNSNFGSRNPPKLNEPTCTLNLHTPVNAINPIIHSLKIPFLVDSGANVSIISLNQFEYIKNFNIFICFTPINNDVIIRTISSHAKPIGLVTLPIQFNNFNFNETFYILNSPLELGILSIHVMQFLRLTIDFHNQLILQNGVPVPKHLYHFVCDLPTCKHCSRIITSNPKRPIIHSVNLGVDDFQPPREPCLQTTLSNIYQPSPECPSHPYNLNSLPTSPCSSRELMMARWCIVIKEFIEQRPELTIPYQQLLYSFKDSFPINKFNVLPLNITPVKLKIISDKVISLRPYRTPYAYQKEIQDQISQLLKHDIITPSSSPYSSPVTLVRKCDNTMRLCIDFRRVNELVPSDLHPLPLIETVLDNLSKARVFSTVDISNAYYQIPIAEESQPLLSFEIKDLESRNKSIVESKNIHRLKLFQQEVNERKISLNQIVNTLLESELDETQYEDYSKAKDDIFNMLVSIEEALSLIETKENTHSDKQLPESNVNLPKINLPIFNDPEPDMEDKSSWEIWSDKNDEAFGIIITTLTNEQAGMFIGETNAKKVWDSLRKTYTGNLEDKIIDIGLELKDIKMKDNETVDEYITRAKNIAARSSSLGHQFTSRELSFHIVRGIHPRYENIAIVLRSKREATIEEIQQTLREEESRRNMRLNQPVENGHEQAYRIKDRKVQQSQPKRCFVCNKKGHLANDCWFRDKQKQGYQKKWNPGYRNHKYNFQKFYLGYSIKRKAYRIYDIMTKRIHEVRSVKFSEDKRGIDYANDIQEDTNCDNLTYKGNCVEIVAEDFLILKEDNPVTESKMKSQEDTSVKLGGDCENDSSQTEPIQERCVKGGRKKGETKRILEERHKARLEEQERKLFEGVRRSQRIKDRYNANLIMEIDHYIPENFKEAMDSGERNEWHKAMEEELREIEKHKVWTLVPREN